MTIDWYFFFIIKLYFFFFWWGEEAQRAKGSCILISLKFLNKIMIIIINFPNIHVGIGLVSLTLLGPRKSFWFCKFIPIKFFFCYILDHLFSFCSYFFFTIPSVGILMPSTICVIFSLITFTSLVYFSAFGDWDIFYITSNWSLTFLDKDPFENLRILMTSLIRTV